nr:hypothetical protein [uncultured Celeribacter sp.]
MLDWLEKKSLPAKYRYSLIELAIEEKVNGTPLPFPLPFNEFDHIVDILVEQGLVKKWKNSSSTELQITAKGQQELCELRENTLGKRLLKATPDKAIGFVFGLLGSVALLFLKRMIEGNQ